MRDGMLTDNNKEARSRSKLQTAEQKIKTVEKKLKQLEVENTIFKKTREVFPRKKINTFCFIDDNKTTTGQ